MHNLLLIVVVVFTILTLGAGCQNTSEKKDGLFPAAIDDLQAQPTPAAQKVVDEVKLEQPLVVEAGLYRGSWFDIVYPQDFAASPLAPTTSYQGLISVTTDEARFTSPDGTVEFYVYSPLWSGEPDYLKLAPGETMINEKTAESGSGITARLVRWVTYRADNGSYYRSLISIKDQVGSGSDLHHVFGIKYTDQAAYERYQAAFVTFKESLRQYAD